MAIGGGRQWRLAAVAMWSLLLAGCGSRLLPGIPTAEPATPTTVATATPFFLQTDPTLASTATAAATPTSLSTATSVPTASPTAEPSATATQEPVATATTVAVATRAPTARVVATAVPATAVVVVADVALEEEAGEETPSEEVPDQPAALTTPAPAPTAASTATPRPVAAPTATRAAAAGACISPQQAAVSIGATTCVEGVVTRLTYARNSNGSPTFADFGEAFTALVWVENRPTFPGIDSWRGKRLRVRGTIEDYQGKAEIILRSASQVEIVN